jgi:hypothetical protein
MEAAKITLHNAPLEAASSFMLSQHVDDNAAIGKQIKHGRDRFAEIVKEVTEQYYKAGGKDNHQFRRAIDALEDAKVLINVAYVNSVGTVNGVPFEEAVHNATAFSVGRLEKGATESK